MMLGESPHIMVAELSHPGEVRDHNEDRYLVKSYHVKGDNRPMLLAVVADGIGGHKAGEVAAQITADTIVNNLTASTVNDPISQLRAVVEDAGRAVLQASQEVPEQVGMGSTVAVAWIIGSRLYTTSAGDSRIYLLREGRFHQITIDHTWIQEAIDYNIITPDEARDHPQAHVLLRYIGSRELPKPDMRLRLKAQESDARSEANQGLRLRRGDQVLLCTDGLTDLVEKDEILHALQEQSPRDAVISLVDLARTRGGHDNITIVLLTALKLPRRTRLSRQAAWILIAIVGSVGLICLTLLSLASGWWFGPWPWSAATPTPSSTQTAAISPAIDSTSTITPLSLTTPTPTKTYTQPSALTATLMPGASSTPFPLPTVAPISTSNP